VAAILLISIGLVMTRSGEVQASTAHMVQIHDDLLAGRIPATQVRSIAEANAFVAGIWPKGPKVPDVPQEHVMACCMRSVQNKDVACVLLRSEGVPVTMAVARAADFRPPRSGATEVSRDGITYLLHQQDDVAMVTHERSGIWVCLIGRVPPERLVDLASQLRFRSR
jgi:hypothetical protein